jgi:hypothetical protein
MPRLMPRSRPAAPTALAAAFLLAGTLWSGTPASASACADPEGVTVVVDFHGLGGGVAIGCAEGGASSGLDALDRAGFSFEFVQNMPGFVCRIDGEPALDSEPCVDTPPASAYWSYWHADPGGTWKVSTSGAGSYAPPPGSVEGWSFSEDSTNGIPPGVAPPPETPATPPTTTPATTAVTTASGSPTTTTAGPSQPTAATITTTTTTKTTPPPPSTTTVTAGAGSGAASPPAVTATSAVEDPAAAASTAPDRAGGMPAIVAAALVLALGVGAVLVSRRRA